MSKTASEMIKEFSEDILEDMEQLYKLEPTSIKPSGVEYVNTGMVNEHDKAYMEVMSMFNEEIRKQIGGSHYSKRTIQPWDIISEYGLDYWAGNVIKYVLRHKDKNGKEDLEKAKHYLEYMIENYK